MGNKVLFDSQVFEELMPVKKIDLFTIDLDLRLHDGSFPLTLSLCDYSMKYIDANIDALISSYDQVVLKSLPTKERKRSFVLGRITAIHSTSRIAHYSPSSGKASVRWGVFNQPIVYFGDSSNIRVSISHSHDIAASVAFYEDCPVAIDIEKICSKRAEIAKSQLSEFETLNLVDGDVDVMIIWTAKESLSKRFETGMMADFSIYEVSKIEERGGYIASYFKNFPQYKVFSYLINGYIYSILLPEGVEIYLR